MLAAAVTRSLLVLLGWYLPCALLLSLGAALLWVLLIWRGSLVARAPGRGLAIAAALLALALTLPTAWCAGVAPRTGGALIEVWGGPRLDDGGPPAPRVTLRRPQTREARLEAGPALATAAPGVGLVALAAGVLFCLARLCLRARRLGRWCAELPVVKRAGRVCLVASDHAAAPFAARWRGVAFIVVPTALWTASTQLRLVIAHEAHHHRRDDLRAAMALGCLRALFFWNPALALWERLLAELQDLACDRQVMRRLRVPAVEYGAALLWAAEASRGRRYVLVGSRGIADGSKGSLARRFDMLDEGTLAGRFRGRSWLLGAAACALVCGASWIARGAIADRRVTRAQVDGLAARIEARTGFSVLVDEQVVERLDQWVAVPEKREEMRKALARMPSYRGMIETTLRAHHLPPELVGMVMAESRFDNEAQPSTPVQGRSVGIWQLIPSTGRRLGLTVTPDRDERLEPRLATEAAATLLSELFGRYGDWAVSVAAYNAGKKKVDALTAGAGSKEEARARVLAGEDEHARYVRSVMASIILIDNPTLLD
jgi:hypothetical protein